MTDNRSVAAELLDERVLRVQQGGDDVDPRSAVGPIRLRRGARWDDGAG